MSKKRITRSAGALAAVAGMAGALTGGIALAQGGTHQAKPRPPGSAPVSVSGNTAHVRASGPRSNGSGAAKKSPPPGSRAVSVNGHTAHVIPSGSPIRGSF